MLLSFRHHVACAVVFSGLAFAGPALAQTPAPSEAQMALGRQIVQLSGMSRSFSPIVPRLMNQMWARLAPTRPEIASDLKIVLESLEDEFNKQDKDIIETSAKIFANRMSEQELKDVAAFFGTISGKKYVDAQPVILDEILVEIDKWSKTISAGMMDRVRAEMKKKGHVI